MRTQTEYSSALFKLRPVCFCKFLSAMVILIMIFFTSACKKKADKDKSDNKEAVYQSIPTVCIWDKISAREEPKRNAAVVSPLYLGETVTFLGVSAIDSTYKNQEYLKVKLSDGTSVWVPSFSLIKGSKPAVVTDEVSIYLRPDLLTITDKKLVAMDIIAVLEEKDGWVDFISEKKTHTGWIQDEKINFNQEEIAFSLMAKRILTEKNNKSLLDKIDSVLDNNPYQNSVFVPLLREIREQEIEKKQVEELMQQNLDSIQ